MSTPRRIKRLLIANRGEIACRIIATCRSMGIKAVTVYTEDDRDLPHARTGDAAVLLAGKTLSETYLNIEKMIDAAKASGADAIHPGYGFLSENARFAEAVTAAGLVFVGPTAETIRRMGDKAASRILCQSIGVPTVPGYDGGATDLATLTREAATIGYPLLVKAAAGGGGKGMRIVEQESVLAGALESARSEAKNAFGDDRLLLEKYLTEPRHIEVQVFSDTHGNHVHLFERECSIQRRHQKIVEESPAPQLPSATRTRMTEAAVKITQHIGYVGAGTVEFIMDRSGAFYFLEMNTRLQVEHPVTEMVVGMDLVKLQLEVAQGGSLPFAQADVQQHGHAIEVRLYAEDPAREFFPCPGVLSEFSLPHLPQVRCENGYAAGNTVSPSYDPMLAKIAAWGETREAARARLLNALAQTRMSGVTGNRAFLMRVLEHPEFCAGNTGTHFIAEHKAQLLDAALSADDLASLAAAYLLFGTTAQKSTSAGEATEHSAWNHPKLVGMR
ncbi:MAG: biotin carboxylase N-terminal domain-containing protein [Alphaproteobacteria bacterium]|nr:biotin carboxylase N-terminal domain-containing protein [Alphaproteobacteria bacterium]